MNKIKRNTFLKMGGLAMLSPLTNFFLVEEAPANSKKNVLLKDDIFKRLVTANDRQVAKLLQIINLNNLSFSRKIGYNFAALAASYCSPGSRFHHSPVIVSKLLQLTTLLEKAQSADGTVNIGNLESPPDTAFLLEPLAAAAYLLSKEGAAGLKNINTRIKNFMLKSGDALIVGGIHTPNHRWVICSALAHLNMLYPNPKYIGRIEEWLGENIFMDTDGQYPERSRNYSIVENNSLITMGRLLNMPSLFDPVRKNLEMTYYLMEPNGELVTTDSRRQDQYESISIVASYLHYRYLAIKDNDSNFAGIAKLIEQMKGFDEMILDKYLFHFLENTLLQEPLPVGIPPPVNYEKLFTATNLLRIRKGKTSVTLFGGVDWPLIIASGRSNSPNFFSFRKGNAILKYVRLSADFFSMGYFYSEGIKKERNQYTLHKNLAIPYYQPLPRSMRNSRGDYKLSPSVDGRFWNKMDFENRPVSNIKKLETTVSFEAVNGKNDLTFQVKGQVGVPVTIELCFLAGGKLTGVSQAHDNNCFLEKGFGKYEFGADTIHFGPGAITHQSINELEGERYSTHFGNLRTKGMYVYLTGVTPFTHKLSFS
ncbi:MAG: hypothetical protein H7Z13_10945 [Ferruginibacter sp.]|nr:hypothetical protein [Ferruginibacter sp.]